MKKLKHRPQEKELFIEAIDNDTTSTIFAYLNGKIAGNLETTGNGWYLRKFRDTTTHFCAPTIQETIKLAEKEGFEFYVDESYSDAVPAGPGAFEGM